MREPTHGRLEESWKQERADMILVMAPDGVDGVADGSHGRCRSILSEITSDAGTAMDGATTPWLRAPVARFGHSPLALFWRLSEEAWEAYPYGRRALVPV